MGGEEWLVTGAGVGLGGVGRGEPGAGMAGAGNDVTASDAISACVAGSEDKAGRDGCGGQGLDLGECPTVHVV